MSKLTEHIQGEMVSRVRYERIYSLSNGPIWIANGGGNSARPLLSLTNTERQFEAQRNWIIQSKV